MIAEQPPSTLVMATAMGYRPQEVRPFVQSLRRCGYSGAAVLFVDKSLEALFRTEALAADIALVRVPRWRPGIVSRSQPRWRKTLWSGARLVLWTGMKLAGFLPRGGESRLTLQLALADRLYPPMQSRFFHYKRFLTRSRHQRILLTDVRDVLFQRDPFTDLPPVGLGVSIEMSEYTLATEPHNAERLRLLYGEGILDRIGSNRVSCAGVTYGERNAMMRYLDLMIGEIENLSLRKVALEGGLDQAMHNALLWSERFQDVHFLETLASPITTLHGFAEADVPLSARGGVLNRDGSEPSVVHQYDRVPGLAPRLLQTLAG